MNASLQPDPSQARQFVAVEGSVNLRDFGGYPTTDGGRVKRGLLFRCGSMQHIPENAWDDFAALNVSVICDLRSEEEAAGAPTPNAAPFECRVHIPIWPGSSNQFREQTRHAPPTEADFTEFMRQVTREIAIEHVHAYEKVMRHLVDTEAGFLIHCTAGKDRTGVGAAIILSVLGVDRQTIIHDYLISNEASELLDRTRERVLQRARDEGREAKIDEAILRVMAGVQADYLKSAFDEIERFYGGVDGYLEAVGVKTAERNHLVSKLLEPAP